MFRIRRVNFGLWVELQPEMDSPWDVVLQFQDHSNPSLHDYVALDAAMDAIRAETDMESRLTNAGFSQKFCGFSANTSDSMTKRRCNI